jgi:hypothetical protein
VAEWFKAPVLKLFLAIFIWLAKSLGIQSFAYPIALSAEMTLIGVCGCLSGVSVVNDNGLKAPVLRTGEQENQRRSMPMALVK